MPDPRQDDAALMEALVAGDQRALGPLIERWERPLYSFAYRYLQHEQNARDVVQETLVRLFSKRDRYDPRYPLSTWLFSIAANLCKNHARWRRRHPEASWEAPASGEDGARSLGDRLASEEADPAEAADRSERVELLRRQIDKLPHDLKTALLLRHYEGLSYEEIGKIGGCSARGVETRLYRARKRLKELLALSPLAPLS